MVCEAIGLDWTRVVLGNNSFKFSDLLNKNIFVNYKHLTQEQLALNIQGDCRLQTTMINDNDNNYNNDDNNNNYHYFIPHGVTGQSIITKFILVSMHLLEIYLSLLMAL